MADDLKLPGCGDTVATDEIGGVHYQRMKLSQGADGTAVDVSAAAPLSVVQQDPDDAARQGRFDPLYAIPVGIDIAHHKIHVGNSFTCQIVVASGMAIAATSVLAFKTPVGINQPHLLIQFITLTGGHVELLEAPTWDNQSGAQQPIFNRKREGSMASSTLLEDQAQAGFAASDNLNANPTTLAGGTAIQTLYAFGLKNRFPGSGREVDEVILKPDTQYAVRFTSDAATNAVQMILNWYENTDA